MSVASQRPTSLQKRVLVIGDHCTDVYHYGTVDRLSPEAPVPILKITRTEHRDGMCNNVAANLKGFGLRVDVFTHNDCITKHRYIEEKRLVHLLRVDNELPIDEIDVEHAKRCFHSNDYDAVVISDYEKGFIRSGSACQLVAMSKEKNVPVFVDTKKHDITCYDGCIVKVNRKEFESIKRFPPAGAAYELIVTLGENGAEWNGKQYKTKKVQLHDVCGAGDTFLAGLVYRYLHIHELEQSIVYANRCASLSVTHFGNFVPGENDVV